MKNLKKVLALVVALTMVLGTVSFAFTDVDSENEVYTAVQTLSSLNILNGYEDGTFGAEKDITRAEFAAVVCRALGMESSANGAKGATQFTDVPADHWASGYINLAAGQGIVNGYGDGKFGPEDNVTYEQAVKMLVVALGFEPMAAQKGGYPTGYLVIANQYGMTKGVSASGDAANRGVVAQLTFNALDMPMMEQTGWGTNTEFAVQDGTGNKNYKTLLTELNVEKLDGAVMVTPIIGGSITNETITYRIDNIDAKKSHYIDNQGNQAANATLYVAEGINVNEYYGMASTVYAREFKNNKYEIIAIMPGDASEVIELTVGDLAAAIQNSGANTKYEVEYYESETATRVTKEKLVVAPTVIFNNQPSNIAAVNAFMGVADDVVLQLINNNDDSDFEMIIAKQYTYALVDEVEADKDRINLEYVSIGGASQLRFDFEDDNKINNFYDKDGNEITLADFAEGDVIAFVASGTNRPDWIEVINLGQNTVTGTVTEIGSAGSNKISIDDVEYKTLSSVTGLQAGDEGVFYLKADGTIFYKDTTASVSSNFAYILEAGYGSASAFSDAWQLKLLTKDGIQVYDMKDSFKVNGANYNTTGTNGTLISGAQPNEFASIDTENQAHRDNFNTRLITFKTDANNAIKEVTFTSTFAAADNAAVGTASSTNNVVTATKVEYKGAAQTIAGKILSDNLVVFNISTGSIDDAKVADINALVDETEYAGYVAKVNGQDEFTCFVIVAGAAPIDYAGDVAVVSETGTSTNGAGETVTKVAYYTANDETVKTLLVDTDVSYISGSAADLVRGTVFMFAENAEKEATDIAIIANGSTGKYVANTTGITAAYNADEDVEFVVGSIYNWRSANSGRAINYRGSRYAKAATTLVVPSTATEDEIVISSSVNAYTVVNNTNATRAYIEVADWQADENIDVETAITTGPDAGKDARTYFVAKIYNGVVTDIVVLGDTIAE